MYPEDFQRLKAQGWDRNWLLTDDGDGRYYVTTEIKIDGKPRKILIARLLLGLLDSRHVVRFKDRNRLNHRRENLKILTRVERPSVPPPVGAEGGVDVGPY